MRAYLFGVGIALSVLINVILGGSNNQTFSARNHQRKRDKKRNLCFVIDKVLGREHCLMCWSRWVTTKKQTGKIKK